MIRRTTGICLLLLISTMALASDKQQKRSGLSPLSDYLRTYVNMDEQRRSAPGSLWSSASTFADLSSDSKARHLNDVLTIRIAEQTLAVSKADVTAQRKFQTSSAITGLPGRISTGGVNPLLAANSDTSLQGKGQASSQSQLTTSVAGHVVSILPNGVLIVEAERRLHLNNEMQTIQLRGMVRPEDVFADNSVMSTALANLEVELKGKGVVSDATRPPNRIVRALLWLVGF
jgi:flagellar L-ring protein precursor FlgH